MEGSLGVACRMSKFTLCVLLLSLQVAWQSLSLQYEPVRPPWHQVAIESLSISEDGKTAPRWRETAT